MNPGEEAGLASGSRLHKADKMKKILIIEDEADMVEGLRFNLEARDYIVVAAMDGETGLEKAA